MLILVDSDAINNNILCSVTCYHFSKTGGLTPETIKSEFVQKNKEQLKKEVKELNIKLNCWINGTS